MKLHDAIEKYASYGKRAKSIEEKLVFLCEFLDGKIDDLDHFTHLRDFITSLTNNIESLVNELTELKVQSVTIELDMSEEDLERLLTIYEQRIGPCYDEAIKLEAELEKEQDEIAKHLFWKRDSDDDQHYLN